MTVFAWARHPDPIIRALAAHIQRISERLDMTDQTVANLKSNYEAYRDLMNSKVQALMDAQAGETLPPAVQAAIDSLAAEITGDTANAAAGSAAAVNVTDEPAAVTQQQG